MLLVDTNILLAAADVSAVEHDRCARLLEEHQNLIVTAAVAERLGASTIATLNRCDFAVVRPVHVAKFELLPLQPQPFDLVGGAAVGRETVPVSIDQCLTVAIG